MRPRSLARLCVVAGLGVVVALAAPASSQPRSVADLPYCAVAAVAPAAQARPDPTALPASLPASPPRLDDPDACRVAPSRVLESAGPDRGTGAVRENAPAGGAERAPGGYRHLGASTAREWAGVTGQLTVTDPGVRAGSYDFLAARFMVKQRLDSGDVAWLEAGWAETGWSGDGRQRVYTYDTNARTWRFYDEFRLSPGDRVLFDVHADADGVWQAWLWWDDRWNLLSAETLPIGPTALVEQYVELHVDPERPSTVTVPAVAVDGVRLQPPGGGPVVPWREDVQTFTGDPAAHRSAGLCLDWTTRYDTWTAGTCAMSSPESPAPAAPAPGSAAPAAPAPGSAEPAAPSARARSSAMFPSRLGPARPAAEPAAAPPRATQADDARPADEEPATVVGGPAPAEDTDTGEPLLPLLGDRLPGR
jgi:hypothetical protein